MTDLETDLHCVRCGHRNGYHAATFCTLTVGTHERPACDCTGWLDPRRLAPPPETGLREALIELLDDYVATHGPDGYPQPMPAAWRTVREWLGNPALKKPDHHDQPANRVDCTHA